MKRVKSLKRINPVVMSAVALAITLVTMVTVATPAQARQINPLDTTYSGFMAITGNDHPVPLSVQLRRTDEIEQVASPSGTYVFQKIDGSFIVDDEGGPYKFARVAYDYETGEIDLRYSRAGSADQNASLRLNGFVQADGSIIGTVYSGLVGPLGEFKIERHPGLALKTRPKYVGTWEGTGTVVATGAVRPMRLILAGTQSVNTNPDDMELGLSLAKTATVHFDGTPMSLSKVMFDYLRHRLIIINDLGGGNVNMTLQATIDPDTGDIEGYVTGVYAGRSVDFKLKHTAGN